jgi:hypothetical protein
MSTSDILGYLSVLIFAIIYWAVLLIRKPATVKNRFRTGQPELLAETIEIDTLVSRKRFVEMHSYGWTAMGAMIMYLLLLTAVYLGYLSDYIPWLTENKPYLPIILSPIAGGILLVAGYWYGKRKISSTQYDNTLSIQHNVHYTFSENHFEYQTAHSTVKAEWKVVEGFIELPDMLIISAGSVGLYLNKASFKSNQLNTFRKFLSSNFDKRKVFR